MLIKEKTRREVEEKLKSLGDFVKIDYLTSCLKQQVDFDTRKFVLLQLSKLYEDKKMFVEAGKMIELAANINTTFQNQINDFLKAAELFVKGGDFDKADKSFEKALVAGNTVVYKASEECPLAGKFIAKIMASKNLPDGVFTEIYGTGEVGAKLIDQPIDFIWFTGSSAVGKIVYQKAAKKFIGTVMELGGSNPPIMFYDFNIYNFI